MHQQMRRIKYLFIIAAASLGLSGCGIFKKGCGCPHFGMVKGAVNNVARIA